jgi:hypothetical protein
MIPYLKKRSPFSFGTWIELQDWDKGEAYKQDACTTKNL